MKLHEAYRRLKLDPVDSFLRRDGFPGHHGIGSTTWMLVEAAIRVARGVNVVLVGHNLEYTRTHLANQCLSYATTLTDDLTLETRGLHQYNLWLRNSVVCWIRWESERTMPRAMAGLPNNYEEFWDKRWKRLALLYRDGPFGAIRSIVKLSDDEYGAYDDQSRFLMYLDLEGAQDLALRKGGDVKLVGWSLPAP